MKKELSNLMMVLMVVLALVCFAVGFTSCTYTAIPSYTQSDAIYDNWKADQKANTQKQLDYANSPAFKAKYSGTSLGNNISGSRANSVIGTNADPYRSIRQPGMGVPDASIGIRIYK